MGKAIIWMGDVPAEVSFEGTQPLRKILDELGSFQAHPCGGRGSCGKCAVRAEGEVSAPNEAEQRAGVRLSCQMELLGDCQIWLDTRKYGKVELHGTALPRPDGVGRGIGAAVDIGTSTLALKLFELETGQELAAVGMLNPQRAVAADVIGRIEAALFGHGERLKEQIQGALEKLLCQACGRAGVSADEVADMVVTGNTTMLYLLTGLDPTPLSRAPFEANVLFDCRESLLGIPVYYPPCMHAFVGADLTCAVVASGMCCGDKTALLCDIGTNGEIALWKEGVLYVTSAAAGPVFEGAGISCGCGCIAGAVDRVWVEDGMLRAHTVGQLPAVGLCGSGLIDAIAAFLTLGEIDETGAVERENLPILNGVCLQPKDVRAVQLAKAAIAAGLETLLEAAHTSLEEIQTLYIAGGFGSSLNVDSACAIGLFPKALAGRAEIIGNGALAGAAAMLLNGESRRLGRMLARGAIHRNLGGDRLFSEKFMAHILF